MLTGALPFAGGSLAGVHSAVLAGRFTPLSNQLPGAAASWQEFFKSAFALDLALRPSSAHAFLSQLKQVLI
jgi:hypothetical protein